VKTSAGKPNTIKYQRPAPPGCLRFVFPVESRVPEFARHLLGAGVALAIGLGLLTMTLVALGITLSFLPITAPASPTPAAPRWLLGTVFGIPGTLITLVGLYLLFRLPWLILGQVRVWVTPDSLNITKTCLGVGVPQRYRLEHVSLIRVRPLDRARWHSMNPAEPSDTPFYLGGKFAYTRQLGTGGIAFNYLGDIIHFGVGINESDALAIIRLIAPLLLARSLDPPPFDSAPSAQ
jgi:hypothetical protein